MAKGYYLEEFEVGQHFDHSLRRTVTEMDNMLFSNMTLNPQPLHIDKEFCKNIMWGEPLMNSLFTLGLMIGIAINDTTVGTTIANLGMEEVKFPHPLFQGDTIRVESDVLNVRESKSHENAGIVTFQHRAYKQSGELVAICNRNVFISKRSKE